MVPGLRKRILIIEDNEELRAIFRLFLVNSEKFILVGDFESFETAWKPITKLRPDLILVDIELPGVNGIEATRKIKDEFPQIDVVMVTIYEDHEMVFEALKAGASGYLTKSNNYMELINSLDEIQKGGAPMSGRIAKMVIDYFHVNPNSPLTRRETEILRMVAEGKTYIQISEKLFISKETAKTHIRNIYLKLQVNTKSAAIEKARLDKLI
jgi:DNA-binding NarL/FixJ family response regulator